MKKLCYMTFYKNIKMAYAGAYGITVACGNFDQIDYSCVQHIKG